MGRDSKFKKLNNEIEEKCDAEIELIVNNKTIWIKDFQLKTNFLWFCLHLTELNWP